MYRVEKFLSEKTAEYRSGSLELSRGSLELLVAADEVTAGEISVRSREGQEIHAFFYSSHYRMQCVIDDFIGKEGLLSYRFDSSGLEADSRIQGEFYILSDVGEYHIPFSVTVRQPLKETSLGEIRNLFHFANLARENWTEAVDLFYSKDFSRLFVGHDRQYYDLYRGLSAHKGNEHNVDEFLVAIHKKQKNTYSVAEQGLLLKDVEEGQRETLTLLRSGWGAARVEIETTGDFIVPSKQYLVTEDFEENKCDLVFTIDRTWLKEGSNAGSILFHYDGGTVQVPVVVHLPSASHPRAEERREYKKLTAGLAHAYLSYVTSEDMGQDALKRAEKIVEKMNSYNGRNVDGRLYQAHILLASLRGSEAKWILSHVENVQYKSAMTPRQYGYYLYLRALLDDDPSFTRSVREQLARLMNENPGDFWLACYYIRLAGEELDEVHKLSMYRQQYARGGRSPILYSEAYGVLKESLAYLMELGDFEIAMLTFAMRYGMYTRETAARVNELAMRKKEMTRQLFHFLQKSYRIFPQDDTLLALCTLMIRSGMRGRECFTWYELAVTRGLRITSLYEYYMMSVDTTERKLPPRMLLMYFAYQCSLDDRRKAYYFASLVENREEISDLFNQYVPAIKAFTLGELEKGSVSENLSILYRYVLSECPDVEVAGDKIRQISFKHLIEVKKENVQRVIVVQNRLKEEAVYPLEKGQAYVDCYTPDYVVLLEDEAGNRFADKEDWTDKRLMSVEKFFMYLEEKGEDDVGFLLHKIYISSEPDFSDKKLLSAYGRLAASDLVEDSFRHELGRRLMHLYFDGDKQEELEGILQDCEIEKTTPQERGEVIQYLVFLDKDERAKELLYTYGFEQVSPKLMTRLIGRELAKSAEFDDRLMALIYFTFHQGKYTQEMLIYLSRYYEGSLRQMRDIFRACVTFDVDASALAERILQAYLFSHGYLAEIGEVFQYYNRSDRKRNSVTHLYIRSMTAGYFVGQQLPQECVFEALEELLYQESDIDEVSKIAYLYYMATEVKDYTERQKQVIQVLTDQLVAEKQYVPFLSAFSGFMPWLKPYSELTYLEYKTLPGSRVTLHYLLEGREEQYCREALKEVCAGYYCRSFVLFFGERLQYYFMEQQGEETTLTESGYIEKSDMTGAETESRFGILNDMIMSESLGDRRTRDELFVCYQRQSLLVKNLFLDK